MVSTKGVYVVYNLLRKKNFCAQLHCFHSDLKSGKENLEKRIDLFFLCRNNSCNLKV